MKMNEVTPTNALNYTPISGTANEFDPSGRAWDDRQVSLAHAAGASGNNMQQPNYQ